MEPGGDLKRWGASTGFRVMGQGKAAASKRVLIVEDELMIRMLLEGMLTDLYVSKRYRNQGIGSLALYEIEDFCRERGIRNIELQVLHHNPEAETFYHKAGFKILPRKVMLMEVRSEKAAHPMRPISGKRR